MDDSLVFTIAEACRALGIGKTKLYSLIDDGRLPARKIGRRTVMVFEDLRRLLDGLPEMPGKSIQNEGDGS
jgi:excisionase family DNA binding protein